MPDHYGPRRHAAPSEFLPLVAVVLLGILLLGVAIWPAGGVPDASIADPVAARADSTVPASDSRARRDVADPMIDGAVIEPLAAERLAAEQLADDPDLQRLRVAAESRRTRVRDVTFRLATFNVLASKFTDFGGSRWPGSGWRTAQAVGYIKAAGVSVVGLQEAMSGQLQGIVSGTGFRAWPGGATPEDSIAWDPGVFEFVSGETFTVAGIRRVYPVVRLRHRESRQEMFFVNTHTAAGGGREAVLRAAGHRASIATVNRLKSAGLPIFLTGDMNDREAFFCQVLPPTGMVAAVGGSTAGGCRPPRSMPVDWIVATPDVSFSGFVNDKSAKARRISDHHFVSATATIRTSA